MNAFGVIALGILIGLIALAAFQGSMVPALIVGLCILGLLTLAR